MEVKALNFTLKLEAHSVTTWDSQSYFLEHIF